MDSRLHGGNGHQPPYKHYKLVMHYNYPESTPPEEVLCVRACEYLLHGDLRLRGHVLLGVADAGGVLVLGHGTHGGGSRRRTGGTLAQSLGG